MTDGDALRRAVLAAPDEDTPRLAYADWLEENGQPDRAAFVRAQVKAARAEPFGPEARAAEARADALRREHHAAWGKPAREWVDGYGFERGFIGHVATDSAVFLLNAARLFDAEPVQSVNLDRGFQVLDRFPLRPVFELPQLRRLRRLAFSAPAEWLDDDYQALTESQHLDALTDLALVRNRIDPPWFRDLLVGGRLPALAGLDVSDVTNLGPALTEALTRAAHRTLRRLDASRVFFTSDHLRRLLTCRPLREVEELRLGWSGRGGDAGPLSRVDLGWVLPWGRLRVLDLAGQRLGDEGVKEIAQNRDATALRWLGLSDNALTAEAVRLLVGAKHLTLYHLDVRGNGLAPAHLDVLRARFPDARVVG